MHKIALGIEYMGTNYNGWQRQLDSNVVSIQAAVESALSKIAAHPVTIVCAGRTDAGVHASGQVVHAEVAVLRTERAWVFGCNAILPRDIKVLWAKAVPLEFDARRSAIQRHYKYILFNSPSRHSLLNEYISWYFAPLNVDNMHLAAQGWLGVNDYSSFRAVGCQSKSPVREISAITVKRSGDLVIFDILANAFLYHMVRNMVGTLCAIGSGKKPIEWAQEVLLAKDRSKAGVTATPHGLYLAGVQYPAWLEVPQHTSGLWFFNQG